MTRTNNSQRPGRRPGGSGTQAVVLETAKNVFAQRGYADTSVRTIADRAAVHPSMINHWFGGKHAPFMAVLALPNDTAQLAERALRGHDATTGERIIRIFMSRWDADGGARFAAVARSMASHELATTLLRELVTHVALYPIIDALGTTHPSLRASLCGSQIIGLGMMRYVIELEPLASANIKTLVTTTGPTIQHYLDTDLGHTDQ